MTVQPKGNLPQVVQDKIKEIDESIHFAWTKDEVIDILESLYD